LHQVTGEEYEHRYSSFAQYKTSLLSLQPGSWTNGVAVFKKARTRNYVLAIAGTNFRGLSSFMLEDQNICGDGQQVFSGLKSYADLTGNDKDQSAKNARIWYGTYLGVRELVRTPGQIDGSNETKNLIDFFKGERHCTPQHKCLLTVAGHSLGATLTPVATLLLSDKVNNFQIKWVHLFAAPAPGTSAFAKYYNGRFGHVTSTLKNNKDVIPLCNVGHEMKYKFLDLWNTPEHRCNDNAVVPRELGLQTMYHDYIKDHWSCGSVFHSEPAISDGTHVQEESTVEFDLGVQPVNVHGSLQVACPSNPTFLYQEVMFQHIAAYYDYLFRDNGKVFEHFTGHKPTTQI